LVEEVVRIGTAIVLSLLGAAGAGLALRLSRGRTAGLRAAVAGIAFAVPWAVNAAVRTPDCSLLFVSDTHGPAASNAALVRALLLEDGISAVLHAGDVFDSDDLAAAWFDEPFRELVARLPFYVAAGNHDMDAAQAFAARFPALPARLVCGHAEVYMLPWSATDADVAWLAAHVAASAAPWRVLVTHRAVWPVGGGNAGMREALAVVLPRIDLVLSGHEHVSSDAVHMVGAHPVRQIIEVSGPKKYSCPDSPSAPCVSGETAYWRLDFYPDEVVATRRVIR
jgi:predicted phosphodiesterase